jgi:hypothetical protein
VWAVTTLHDRQRCPSRTVPFFGLAQRSRGFSGKRTRSCRGPEFAHTDGMDLRVVAPLAAVLLIACGRGDWDDLPTDPKEGTAIVVEDAEGTGAGEGGGALSPPPGVGGGEDGNTQCIDVPTDVTMVPSQRGFLAGGQYVAAMLEAEVAPRPEALSVANLEDYLLDAAREAPTSLSAHVRADGAQVLEGFLPAATAGGGAVDFVVVVDVSPSNASTADLRDGMLDAIAGQLPPDSTFAIVAFANDAQVILEPVPATEASAEVARTRSALAPQEGHDLSRALKVVTSLPRKDRTRHVLVLTDAGFVPDEQSLALASALSAEQTAVSIAQIARSPVDTGEVPAFRADTLRRVAEAGAGVALFLTSPTVLQNDDDFARWFAASIEAPALRFSLPPGIDADVEAMTPDAAEDDQKGGFVAVPTNNPTATQYAALRVRASCGALPAATVVFGADELVPFGVAWDGEIRVDGDGLPNARNNLALALGALRVAPEERCQELAELATGLPECEAGMRACIFETTAFELLVTTATAQLCKDPT